MSQKLNPNSQRTLNTLHQHPITHGLEWRDIKGLFESLGDVTLEHNGNLMVTVAGNSHVFQSISDADIATEEHIMQIRHFLAEAGVHHQDHVGHLLLVIDHKEAQIFQTELAGAEPIEVKPYDPDGSKAHVHSHTHEESGHDRQPNYEGYFSAIAEKLKGAEKILIFGSGTGSSSAMDLFATWLGKHHKNLADLILDTVKVDQDHLTEAQLLAKAREIYSK